MEAYEWVNGSRIKADANAVGNRFRELRMRNGGVLSPEDIVKDARNPSAPYHGEFEWNLKKAAHLHHLNTARYLMRSIKEVIVRVSGKKESVRAYFPIIRNQEPRAYRATRDIMSDATLRMQLIENALGDHRNWENRYSNLAALAEEIAMVISAGEKARKSFARKRARNSGARPSKGARVVRRPSVSSSMLDRTPPV
jgi:hypothetical protein